MRPVPAPPSEAASPSETDPIAGIVRFLSRHVRLSEAEVEVIRQVTRIARYPKGAILLAEGDVARENWLVLQGCVRVFRGTGNAARTIAIHTEYHPVIPSTYGTSAPSPVTIECLEDVVVSFSTPEDEERCFTTYPAFESVCRVMGDVLAAHIQEAHIDALTLSPEERYLDLIARRPELLQRVAQYHIASLLGIQPETLSRIRRRVTRRGR